jgi:hypothetical protein
VPTVVIDSQSLSHVVFPSDVQGSPGPSAVGLNFDLVLVAPDRTELQRVPIRIERRLWSADAADMWGFDSTKTLEAYIRATRSGSFTIAMRAVRDKFSASQAQFVIKLVRLMAPPNALALTDLGAAVPAVLTVIDQPAAPPPPPGMAEYIDALASLEAYVGEAIPVPDSETDPGRLRDLEVAASLLAGETVRGQWQSRTVQLTAAEARELVRMTAETPPVLLEESVPWTVHVGTDREYRIFPVLATFRSVRVAESPVGLDELSDEASVTVRIEPADDDRAVEMLYSPAEGLPAATDGVLNDDPVTLVPAAFFDELVTSLEAPDEPLPELARAVARLRELQA